jgi:hypothetical protein
MPARNALWLSIEAYADIMQTKLTEEALLIIRTT